MNKKPIIIPRGEDRKIEIALSGLPDGVALEDAINSISITAGHVTHNYSASSLKKTEDGKYYLPIETTDLGVGDITLSAHIRIPDEDFDDEYRDEYPVCALNAKIIPR